MTISGGRNAPPRHYLQNLNFISFIENVKYFINIFYIVAMRQLLI